MTTSINVHKSFFAVSGLIGMKNHEVRTVLIPRFRYRNYVATLSFF